jgi:TRAP-type C4-dicarboxylate transport system permease small subunit
MKGYASKFPGAISRLAASVSVLCLLLIVVLLGANILGRELNFSDPRFYRLARILVTYITFLSLGLLFLNSKQIEVTYVYDMFSKRTRDKLDVFRSGVTIFVLLFYLASTVAIQLRTLSNNITVLEVPTAVLYSSVIAGLLITLLVCSHQLLQTVRAD